MLVDVVNGFPNQFITIKIDLIDIFRTDCFPKLLKFLLAEILIQRIVYNLCSPCILEKVIKHIRVKDGFDKFYNAVLHRLELFWKRSKRSRLLCSLECISYSIIIIKIIVLDKILVYTCGCLIINDFIFAIVCEELGLFGALTLIALFIMLIWRGFHIAKKAPDTFSALLVAGLTAKVGLQALLNIAVVTTTIPTTGIALPFFSYGGTALVMQLAEMGIILSISRFSSGERLRNESKPLTERIPRT